jgi:CheY-like chemotaxis protein
MTGRVVPLVVVASPSAPVADRAAAQLREAGYVVCAAHSDLGCLRVATSVGPDIILLDPALPRGLERQLRAHPISAPARIVRLAA